MQSSASLQKLFANERRENNINSDEQYATAQKDIVFENEDRFNQNTESFAYGPKCAATTNDISQAILELEKEIQTAVTAIQKGFFIQNNAVKNEKEEKRLKNINNSEEKEKQEYYD
ncbi:hypothetical protein RFI_06108 [Reticulomyxa filosa]|uniref:Uncharacterized protein n=1 Tax=Reticulomyxa filosa TaxID=46433 RepID=X6NYF2_RETFI|nr:hypothetical protein RFI_06108 [Reticulomyxa filosa]|eukprot:ETO31011.1 hypothetical protein RFI_06108 [Reticulomyxa filosa]